MDICLGLEWHTFKEVMPQNKLKSRAGVRVLHLVSRNDTVQKWLEGVVEYERCTMRVEV